MRGGAHFRAVLAKGGPPGGRLVKVSMRGVLPTLWWALVLLALLEMSVPGAFGQETGAAANTPARIRTQVSSRNAVTISSEIAGRVERAGRWCRFRVGRHGPILAGHRTGVVDLAPAKGHRTAAEPRALAVADGCKPHGMWRFVDKPERRT